MGHVEHSAMGKAPVEFAFAYVTDHENIPHWMFGVRHFTPVGEQITGVGAVFDTALHLGPTTLHLRAEITEWEDNSLVTLRAVKGIEGTIRWTFASVEAETTKIGAVVDYRVPGGLAGKALDRVIKAFVGPAIRFTEKHLRQQVESAYVASKGQPG